MDSNAPIAEPTDSTGKKVPPVIIWPDEMEDDTCVLRPQTDSRIWIREYIRRQMEWAHRTFGPHYRREGLSKHIQKELLEIERKPHDLEEWIDIIILAIDGATRCGLHGDHTPDQIIDMLDMKQQKNFDRVWPTVADPTQPIEHDRSQEGT